MASDLARVSARSKDVSPVSNAIHNVFLAAVRRDLARSPIGENENLGPSYTDRNDPDHVFRYDERREEFVFGSKVEYAAAYSRWRARNRLGPIIDLRKSDQDAIAQLVGDFIAIGRR